MTPLQKGISIRQKPVNFEFVFQHPPTGLLTVKASVNKILPCKFFATTPL